MKRPVRSRRGLYNTSIHDLVADVEESADNSLASVLEYQSDSAKEASLHRAL